LKTRTEEFLYLLLWTAEALARPTFRNLDESFEGWAYRNGLLRRIAILERQGALERRNKKDRIYRLTSAGRLRALGGRDPAVEWARPWDGWWRLICFDVPTAQNRRRRQLRHYLRSRRFGLLQRSIWITPNAVEEQRRLLKSTAAEVKSLVLLEARTCGGESDSQIVTAAWDFRRINELYARHLSVLDERPVQKVRTANQANSLLQWARTEYEAWNKAIREDPLLPQALLPTGYLGQRAWKRRMKVIASARRSTNNFNLVNAING
jgi:DNA-binding transcriptional regulator PaaX